MGVEAVPTDTPEAMVTLGLNATAFVIADPKLPDCPIVYANAGFEQITGYSAEEVIGKNCRFLQGAETNQAGLKDLRQSLREKRPCRTLLRNYRKDGTFFWNDLSLTPIFNGRGEAYLMVGIQNPISPQAMLEMGVTASAPSGASGDASPPLGRLGEILIDMGVVSRASATAAVQLQQNGSPKRLGEILVENFGVPEFAIVQALSLQIEDARARCSQTDLLMKTAFAVRLAQTTMGAVPEKDLPIFSLSQPLSDAGGDTFYSLGLEDGTQLLLLADVAGHSVISSYAVASFLGMFCALSTHFRPAQPGALRKLLLALNTCLLNGPFADVPICVLTAHWNVSHGRLHIINAGIPHGLVFRRASGRCTDIAINGNPLGVLEDPWMEEQVVRLQAGDRVVFGSDGLFETESAAGVLFQDEAAAQWNRLGGKPLGDALASFCALSRDHAQGSLKDDVLAVAIEQPCLAARKHSFQMLIESTFEAIDVACLRLVEFLREHEEQAPLGSEAEFYLILGAREALSNAVIHGNGGVRSKGIFFACSTRPPFTDFRMTITDEGYGFDFETYAVAEDLQTSERGRGMTILRASTKAACMTGGELCLEFNLAAIAAAVSFMPAD